MESESCARICLNSRVRPKAGAHVWGRADQLALQHFDLWARKNIAESVTPSSAYFLFFGGRGCARITGMAG